MSSNPSDKLRINRPDLSPYLFTFLRDQYPQEILHIILTEGRLLSSEHDYICFTDAPITCYLPNLDYFNSWKERGRSAMFTYYGIGISRDWLIKNMGARPVIYGSKEEESLLPDSMKWRFLELDVEKNDFSWLREWRINKKEINLNTIPKEHVIFIVPTEDELKDFASKWNYDVDFDYDHGETRPYLIEIKENKREWKGFAISQIKQMENDFQLSGATADQKIGETL